MPETSVLPQSHTPPPVVPAKPKSDQVRLTYLDGLRGLAALYVVLFHVYHGIDWQAATGHVHRVTHVAAKALAFGRQSVVIFIVLSGYCLMLPVARAADQKLRGGVWDYLKRRARRILPPYYAALLLTLLLLALIPALRHPQGLEVDEALPAFTPGVLLSHLFLVHNFSAAWSLKIDPPMWSVATEWQIYFIFPALLIPLWRRAGMLALALTGIGLGILPHYLRPHEVDTGHFYFLGLFCLGMIAAIIGFSAQPRHIDLRRRVPWFLVAFLFIIPAALQVGKLPGTSWLDDTLVGMGVACLLIFCTRHLTGDGSLRQPLLLKVLESRVAVTLGAFSYSLYLVHQPVLTGLDLILHRAGLTTEPVFWLLLLLGVPSCLGVAYLFYLLFERRFLPGHRHATHAMQSAGVSASAVVSRPSN